MTSLDNFLQNGPVDGNHAVGMKELRDRVLYDRIPANSDGMVPAIRALSKQAKSLKRCPV